MKPSRPGDLLALAVLVGVLSWLVVRAFYGTLPPVSPLAGLPLLVLAAVEVGLARVLRPRIERRPGARLLDPIMAARSVALAKASSLGGAMLVGAWAGLGVFLLQERNRLTAAVVDTPGAVFGLLSAVALVAAALWLEHTCRTPDDRERH